MEIIRQKKDLPLSIYKKKNLKSGICIKCTVLKAVCGFHLFFSRPQFFVSLGNFKKEWNVNTVNPEKYNVLVGPHLQVIKYRHFWLMSDLSCQEVTF